MKKLILIPILCMIFAQPVIDKSIKKLDEKTLEVTTVTTTTSVVEFDRAVLQTELDHIPDRRAKIQEQMDAVDEREAELIKMLEVFK